MVLPQSIGILLFLIVLALVTPLSVMAADYSITLSQLEEAFAGHCPNSTQGEVISCDDALPYLNAAIQKYGKHDIHSFFFFFPQ